MTAQRAPHVCEPLTPESMVGAIPGWLFDPALGNEYQYTTDAGDVVQRTIGADNTGNYIAFRALGLESPSSLTPHFIAVMRRPHASLGILVVDVNNWIYDPITKKACGRYGAISPARLACAAMQHLEGVTGQRLTHWHTNWLAGDPDKNYNNAMYWRILNETPGPHTEDQKREAFFATWTGGLLLDHGFTDLPGGVKEEKGTGKVFAVVARPGEV